MGLGPLALALPAAALADEPPKLAWDRPIRCIETPQGKTVRVQCDEKKGVCLVAPNEMSHTGDPLERTQPCATTEPKSAYSALPGRLVAATAESPPGYARGESGRAFQVKFDLLNRLYIGAAWAPTFQTGRGAYLPPGLPFGRGHAELGIHLSILSPKNRSRHDMRLLEGSATFADLELRGTLFSYDYQHVRRRPAFWLSTFFGEPEVHPILPHMGWGFRILSVTDRQPTLRDALDIEYAEVHLAYNPWQSNDMYSHLRVEFGGDIGGHWEDRRLFAQSLTTGRVYIGPTAAIESRLSLGQGGLHYLFSELTFRRPTLFTSDGSTATINRLAAQVAYEGVLIAINDQPISVRVAAQGTTQNDFASDVRAVDVRFTAGLRMSFWAPPRVFEPMPAFEEP
jgi:hypothetical protein